MKKFQKKPSKDSNTCTKILSKINKRAKILRKEAAKQNEKRPFSGSIASNKNRKKEGSVSR